MTEIIYEAGWPAYPILALGGVALVQAIRHALWPQRSLVSIVVGLSIAAVLMGLFGTSLGVQHTIEGVGKMPPEERWIFLIGLRESLQCFALSMALVIPAVLLATVGCHKLVRRQEAIDARS